MDDPNIMEEGEISKSAFIYKLLFYTLFTLYF